MRYLARAFLSLLLAAALLRSAALSFAWADPQEARVTDPKVLEELKVIAMHHDAARKQIRSMSVTGRVVLEFSNDPMKSPQGVSPYPKGRLVRTSDCEWDRAGDKYRILVETETRALGGGFEREEVNGCVVNDAYVAEIGMAPVYLIIMQPHRGISQMLPNVSKRVEMQWQYDPTLYGFTMGTFVQTLTEQLSGKAGLYTWQLETKPDSDGTVYIIEKVYSHKGSTGRERARYELDPDKDFLMTKGEYWDGDGVLKQSFEVELQQLPGGRWFPKSGRRVRPEFTEQMEIKSAVINEPIDDARFQFESFQFDATKMRMKVYTEDGRRASYMTMRDGQWVPMEPDRRSTLTR